MKTRKFNLSETTYNLNSLENWQADIDSIPAEIDASKKQIALLKHTIDALSNELQILDTKKIQPSLDTLTALNARVDVLSLPEEINDLSKKVIAEQNALDGLNKELSDVNEKLNPIQTKILELNNAIDIGETRQKIKNFRHQSELNQTNLQVLKRQLNNNQTEISLISSQIISLKSQLVDLRAKQDNGYYSSDANPSGYSSSTNANPDLEAQLNQLTQKKNEFDRLRSSLNQKINKEQQDLSGAESEIKRLEEHIDRLYTQGYYCNSPLEELRDLLQFKKSERVPLDTQKNKLSEEKIKSEKIFSNLQSKKNVLQRRLTEALHHQKKFEHLNDTNELLLLIKKETEKRDNLWLEKEKIENSRDVKREELKKETYQLDSNTELQNKLLSNRFLTSLRDEPQHLVCQLAGTIKLEFEKFEKNNPAKQPFHTRTCLANANYKIGFFLNQWDAKLGVPDPTLSRLIYFQLCGFLLDMKMKAINDPSFVSVLNTILDTNPIRSTDATAAFEQFKHHHPAQISYMNEEMLSKYEEDDYDMTSKTFAIALSQISKTKEVQQLFKDGNALLHAINDEKKHADKKNDLHFDLKYHTTVLKKAINLLEQPSSKLFQDQFKETAQHTSSGKPSLCKKISGIALMFLGSAIATLSVLGKVFSVGLSTPVSMAGILTGVGLIGGGLTLFCHGRQKALSKRMENFEKAAEQVRSMPSSTKEQETASAPVLTPVLGRYPAL